MPTVQLAKQALAAIENSVSADLLLGQLTNEITVRATARRFNLFQFSADLLLKRRNQ